MTTSYTKTQNARQAVNSGIASEILRHLVKAWEFADDDIRIWIEMAIASQYDLEFK